MIRIKTKDLLSNLILDIEMLKHISMNADNALVDMKSKYPDLALDNYATMLKGTNRAKAITAMKNKIKNIIELNLTILESLPVVCKDKLIDMVKMDFTYTPFGKSDATMDKIQEVNAVKDIAFVETYFAGVPGDGGVSKMVNISTLTKELDKALVRFKNSEMSTISNYVNTTSSVVSDICEAMLIGYEETTLVYPLDYSDGEKVGTDVSDTKKNTGYVLGGNRNTATSHELKIADILLTATPLARELDVLVGTELKELKQVLATLSLGKAEIKKFVSLLKKLMERYLNQEVSMIELDTELGNITLMINNYASVTDERLRHITTYLDDLHRSSMLINRYSNTINKTATMLGK